jgi:hypothetical protein
MQLLYPKGCKEIICGFDALLYATLGALGVAAMVMVVLFEIRKKKPHLVVRVVSGIIVVELVGLLLVFSKKLF